MSDNGTTLKQLLDDEFIQYRQTVIAFAEDMFAEHVKPLCDSRGWSFKLMRDRGGKEYITWRFFDAYGEWRSHEYWPDEELKHVIQLALDVPVPGFDRPLASFMPEYTP